MTMCARRSPIRYKELRESRFGSSGHDARGNAHWHEFLEEQLARIWNIDLWYLEKQRNNKPNHTNISTRFVSYLCFVLAASALKGLLLHVGNGNEPTQVTHIDLVGIRGSVEPLVEELGSPVSYLTVTLHLTKTQTTVTARTKEYSNVMQYSNGTETVLGNNQPCTQAFLRRYFNVTWSRVRNKPPTMTRQVHSC